MKIMEVELLLEKYMVARRGKWMLEPICKNASEKIVDFLIETAIDDFHSNPDKTDNSTAAIIENLGFSGRKSAAVFLNSLQSKEDLKRYHAAARKGKENFISVTDYTLDDIQDLSVPDFELSDNCEKNFEYDGSIITVGVNNGLKVFIKDEVGREYEKFDFLSSRILTKFIQDLTDTAEYLSCRFSEAIVTGRRFKYSVFEEVILSHPLMRKFAENLILAEYNEFGRPRKLLYFFMGKFLDMNGQAAELHEKASVGFVNSMDIDERTLLDIKDKYPAALNQLKRGIYRTSDIETGQPAVTRFFNYLIDYTRFNDGLSGKGYELGCRENKNYRALYRINAASGLAAKIIYAAPENSRHIKNTRITKILFYNTDTLKKKNGKYATDRVPPLHTEHVDKYFFSDVLNDIYELL